MTCFTSSVSGIVDGIAMKIVPSLYAIEQMNGNGIYESEHTMGRASASLMR